MPVDQFEQLVVHGFGFLLLATSEGLGGAMAQMILHQIARDTAEGFLHGSNLRDDVGAVAVVFNHFLQATDLAFNAAETLAIGFLQGGIDSGSFAARDAGFARANGDRAVPFRGRCANTGLFCPCHHNTPQPYIYPIPLSNVKSGGNRSTTACGEGWYTVRMTLVDITYELQSPLTQDQLRHLGEFANTYGLRSFRVDEEKNQLSFEYDASRLRETQVEHVLAHARIAVTRRVNSAGWV
jgi:hypothetical protein